MLMKGKIQRKYVIQNLRKIQGQIFTRTVDLIIFMTTVKECLNFDPIVSKF